MIERVLDTYITEVNQKDPFIEKIKKLDFFSKFTMVFILGGMVALFTCICLKINNVLIVGGGLYICLSYIFIAIMERIRQKNWDENSARYLKTLDILRDVLKLPTFDLYDKYKLKQLIRKYNQSIEKTEKEDEQKNKSNSAFVGTYIIPVISFIAGMLSVEKSTIQEVLTLGLYCIFFICTFKFIFSNIREIMKGIDGNRLEKKKYIADRLQDLLDRDFEIKAEDLL